MGILQKAGKFLGISKAGEGIATTRRILGGEVKQDIQRQEENTSQVNKILYAYKQESDPIKKKQLLNLAKNQGELGVEMSASKIDPGLNLSNKEVIGSFANIGLNVATPGAFKGGKASIIGKNAALGSAFGLASGLEKNRSVGGI